MVAEEGSLAELESEVRRLRSENQRLLKLLSMTPQQAALPGPAQTGLFDARPGQVSNQSPANSKIAFFESLFAARTDVYATRWQNTRTGSAGWVPAVKGSWRKDQPASQRKYLPLTADVLRKHLSGEIQLGLYPMLDGDRCWWIAVDFDGSAAMLDALAYVKAARANGVPAALEVSSSGLGAHVWIYFTTKVPAIKARELGSALLREAMALRGAMDLASYDRLFPSQDVLAASGVGNLIAAPLHGTSRKQGRTVFLDLATMEPHPDQWAYLSSLGRMTPREVDQCVNRIGRLDIGSQTVRVHRAKSTGIQVPAPAFVAVTYEAGIVVGGDGLPPALRATLKHAASISNPAFYERQRLRKSTWDTPRFIKSYDEKLDGSLVLPRGLRDRLTSLLEQSGSKIEATDRRIEGETHRFEFAGELDQSQQEAIEALVPHDLGVLVAPPGSGKTVMACAMIAHHATSALVLVDRKALADQWRTRIQEFLEITPGQIGGGRKKITGIVDIAMLQTLARKPDVATLLKSYGFVIVDECHHAPAAAFDHAIAQIPARRWLGLTATPYRRDKLDELIAFQLGPVRHTMDAGTGGGDQLPLRADKDEALTLLLHVHETGYTYSGDADPSEPGGISAIYRDLLADSERNATIADDVSEAMNRGRNCLVLTQWIAHLDLLARELQARGHHPVTLRGGMGLRAQRAAIAELEAEQSKPVLVVATGPFIGEGFDQPMLDTLFLAAPVAFKGRIVQYVGRIMRAYPGKTTAEVHDYHDVNTRVLASSLAKRVPGYTSLGFPDPRR